MLNKSIVLISLVFLALGCVPAQADEAMSAPETAQTVPTSMDDEALASYITGRLSAILKDEGYDVSQNCDTSGCSVVVQ